jgi:hypothetical protein
MSKGAVIDEEFIQMVGLSDQLLTLSRSMENKHHEVLQESLFHITVQELPEIIYLDRKYVFENQLSIRSSYGKDEKILVWLQRVQRAPSLSRKKEVVELLMVRDLFLLNDWREFHRFKQFVKSMRILDAQARNYLVDHHQEFPTMVNDPVAMSRILLSLETVADWPNLDQGGDASTSLEAIAKTYGKYLAPVRSSPLLPKLLLERNPDARFNLFRLFSFVEDPEHGSEALVRFLINLGKVAQDVDTIAATKTLGSGRDLQRAFSAMRKFLISPNVPVPEL